MNKPTGWDGGLVSYHFDWCLDLIGKDLLFEDFELVRSQDAGILVLSDLNLVFVHFDCRAARAFTAQFYFFH
jgi:hypothetical protein